MAELNRPCFSSMLMFEDEEEVKSSTASASKEPPDQWESDRGRFLPWPIFRNPPLKCSPKLTKQTRRDEFNKTESDRTHPSSNLLYVSSAGIRFNQSMQFVHRHNYNSQTDSCVFASEFENLQVLHNYWDGLTSLKNFTEAKGNRHYQKEIRVVYKCVHLQSFNDFSIHQSHFRIVTIP